MTSIVYVSTSETTVGCTFSSTEVVISNLQGPQGPSGVVSVVDPITFDQLTGEIGINATSSDVASYVVQRDANQRFSIGAIDWDTNSTQSTAEARLYWNGNESLNLGLGGGNVTISLGQEVINYVTNAESTTLNIGEVVYLFGAQGDRPSVKRASNTSDATSAKTFGIVAEAITAGGAGFVVKQGICSKINTLAYNPGDVLWLSSTPGQFTTTKPVAPNHLVFVGVVLRSNAGNGLVYVSPQNGYELDEIHDVLLTSQSDGQFLVYQASNDLWVNRSVTATSPVNYNASTQVITIDDSSVSAKGAVRLSSSTDSTSEILAATPKAVKAAYDLANTANTTANAAVPKTTTITTSSPLTGGGDLSTNRTFAINDATTAQKGAVQLSSSVTSTSEILAATPKAVKDAYDLANTANTTANAAVPQTRTISTTAPLAGGGDLTANRTLTIADASTTVKGAVQLTNSISSTSTTTAATPSSVKTAYDLAAAAVPNTRTISTTAPLTGGGALSGNLTLAASAASTSASGVVQLSTSVTSTSQTLAATVSAVKTAYDFADEIQTRVIMEAI